MSVIVVANRGPGSGPVPEPSTKPVGGLVTALLPLLRATRGVWVSQSDTASTDREGLGFRCHGVHLTREEQTAYYKRVSNEVLWPAFHCFVDRMRLLDAPFQVYQEVNRRFAAEAMAVAKPGDTFWVHDFHLCLVPMLLRKARPSARIGWFCHIPFPPPEILALLPWKRELLEGLLGADLLGFHCQEYVDAFLACARRFLGSRVDHGGAIQHQGRQVRVAAHPIGIPVQELGEFSRRGGVRADVSRLLASGQRFILGVDRLEYTKGLVERALAVERLLERRPEWREKVRYLQIAVPSRTDVVTYQDLRRELERVITRINGRFATPLWVPIHILFRSYPIQKLVAFYAAADVAVVTPLRDGMNLVAMEFVASKVPEADAADGAGFPPGVLVLSEFAGAVSVLSEALIVNPYDLEATADAIHEALTMPSQEARRRMESMRGRIARNSVQQWGRRFLEDLQAASAPDPVAAPRKRASDQAGSPASREARDDPHA